MRPYEVMIIFDAGLEEDSIRAVLDRATQSLQAAGGVVGRVDQLGKARLAYEIKHRSEGVYTLVEASAEPAAMAEMDRVLSLADEVVRHKVIRMPDAAVGRSTRPVLTPAEPVPAAEPPTGPDAETPQPVAAVSTTEPTGE
jgi:small subunit ribosomal protein S6